MKTATVIAVLLMALSPCSLFAQNLVSNSSFEKHSKIDCYSCHLDPIEFERLLPGWQDLNSNPILCDCDYLPKNSELKYGNCRAAHEHSCNYIQMEYTSKCTDWDHKSLGCSSYLGTKLKSDMEVGSKYEVSLLIYIPENESGDQGLYEHIGISLYPQPIRNPKSKMLNSAGFLLDTVLYNKWYEVSWKIRPICNLNYLVIGAYRSADWPKDHRFEGHQAFFIDKVSIKEVSESTKAQAQEYISFCHPESKADKSLVTKSIEKTTCYFNFADSTLSLEETLKLDSFGFLAKQYPKIAFVITGHTDSIGSNHLGLSTARINNVLNYLEEKHNIINLRFLRIAEGNKHSVADNKNESGRRLNRRVEIHQVGYPLENLFYRHALNQVEEGKHIQAFQTLGKWLNIAPHESKILMLFDMRLKPIQSDIRWSMLTEKVKKSYSYFTNPRLSFSLDSLWAEDQRYRTLKYYVENLNVYVPRIDKHDKKWDVDYGTPAEADQIVMDSLNYLALSILSDIGHWPKRSAIGERQEKAFFLIMMHSNDTVQLSYLLPSLKKRCIAGESEWLYYATMYDRIQVLQDKPQRYATQYKIEKGNGNQTKQLYPVESPEMLNDRRMDIGLPPVKND